MHEVNQQESGPVEPIWERLTNTKTGIEESDAALAAFRIYRSLSPASRSLYAVALARHRDIDPLADEPPKPLLRQVQKWSAQWSWIHRALAWDNEQDRIHRQERSERLQKVVASQRQMNSLATQLLVFPLKRIIELQQADETLKTVDDRDLSRALHRVIRALPELQARERTLLTPIDQGKRELEMIESEHMEWTSGEQSQEMNGADESGDGSAGRGRETPEWVDEPWARQVDRETGKPEPSRAFHAFTLFRDLPPQERTLREVTARLRGTNSTEPAAHSDAGGPAKRSRRREYVSETVESWSARWEWKMRARAWDDEQDRVRRRAEQADYERMEKDQSRQLELARRAAQCVLSAAAKRFKSGALFAGENTELVRIASEGVALLTRMQEAEQALFGERVDYRERQAIKVDGFVFCWGEVNCECGHPHSKHDQTDPDPCLVPCTIAGCACRKFIRPDAEEEARVSVAPSRGGLPSSLAVSYRQLTE